jgi:hypothetical protein
MRAVIDHPLLVFLVSFSVLWLAAWIGASFLRTRQPPEEMREDFGYLLGATLTLLALIISFLFVLATNRYDQRKNFEEDEANAIGTEYLRADLLPAADAAKVRALLLSYLDQRIQFHNAVDREKIREIDAHTARLQAELWAAVLAPAAAQPTPVTALAVAGMNDVLNRQGYTQSAWWNRVPKAAWGLALAIALCCNLLFGYGVRKVIGSGRLLAILPLIVSIAFAFIADIDSPRAGLIRVQPQNLESLAASLRPGK